MANKKINELDSRASLSLSDLLAVGDPTTGYLYKITITDLKTLTGAGVISFNGRVGSVTPAEGDYSLNQLSDVIITSATNGDIVKYNGSNWVNVPMYTGTIAQYVDGTGAYQTFPTLLSSDRLVTEVRNTTGATVTKGTVIYLSGSSGTLPTIAKAQANSEATSSSTYGVVQNDIANNSNGYVVVIGNLTGIDTSAFNAGDVLWLSPTVAGGVTTTKPSAPNNSVYIGIVTRSNNSAGTIEVKIQNGYELDELHNVAISSVANNEVLVYESSSTLWKNKSIATILGYTPISLSSLSASAPLSYNSGTGAFTISQASGSTDGYLSSTDWSTFNSKQNALTNPVTGTGTSGHVTYFTGSTSVAGSANFFWDATNNRLGIGLTNPQRSLEIYSATADSHLRLSGSAPSVSMGEAITGSVYQAKFGLATANNQYITGSVPGDFVIISQTASTIWFNNGAERMRVTGSGNVGIGTASPSYLLDVTGTGRFTGALTVTNNVTIRPTSGYNAYFQTSGTAVRINYLNDALSANVGAAFRATDYSFQDGSGSGVLTIASTGAATFSSSVTAASDYINGTIADNGTGRFRGSFASVNTSSSLAKVQFGGGEGSQFRAYMEVRQVWNGSGTDQDVAFTTFKGGVGSAEAMIIKGNGNVGIGTTTVSGRLTLNNPATDGSTPLISIRDTTNVYEVGYLNFNQSTDMMTLMNKQGYSASGIAFGTNNTERMRINKDGNVLISTTTSINAVFKLQVGNGSSDARALFNPNNPYSIALGNGASSLWYIGVNAQTASNGLQFYSNQLGSAVMTINTSGNVGIGTSSPSELLDIRGTNRDVSSGEFNQVIYSTSSQDENRGGALGFGGFYTGTSLSTTFSGIKGGKENGFGDNTAGTLTFHTRPNGGAMTERMRISSSGLVGIGTSSPLSALDKTLTVFGTGIFQTTQEGGNYNENLRLNRNTGNGYASLIIGGAYNSTAGTGTGQWAIAATPVALSYRLDFDYNGATKGYIDPSTGAYVALSDKNKKKDFEDSEIGLQAILGLKPTLYRMEDEEGTEKQLGFIAQEVKDFIPQAYSETVDGFIGLQDRPIIAALVKAIQEQQQQIEELKAKIK